MKMQVFTCLLVLFGTLRLSTTACAQSEVEIRANEDQISTPTWRALGPVLGNHIQETSGLNINEELSEQYNIEYSSLRKFLIYTLNYTSTDLNLANVTYRYPHYNTDSIQADFSELVVLGLIEEASLESYKATIDGMEILGTYWQLRLEQAAAYDVVDQAYLEIFNSVLQKIINEATLMEGSRSVHVRLSSRPDNFEELPLIIQVTELLKEYTAFINDMSHYKYDHLLQSPQGEPWADLQLSPMAKELMSASRDGRVYEIQRCYDQPNWRMGKEGCDTAINELIDMGFVQTQEGTMIQTEAGAKISAIAEALNDQMRYSAWRSITMAEYELFVEGIDWVLDNLQPNNNE